MRLIIRAALAVLLALPAGAACADEPSAIMTSATARTRLPNTVADVALGVDAQGKTVAAVQDTLARSSDRLLAYLRAEKVDRLRTEQVAVTPETESVQGKPDRIVGFEGRMRVSFRVPAERLGGVIGGALGQGGNALESTSLAPTEEEVAAARQGLAAEAVRTALAQARAVAEAAGLRLGPVRQIRVDPGRGLPLPAPMMTTARMAAVAAPIATEAGESEVSATVAVTVGLLD